MSQYTEFRKDGWPICPRCGEDELQNPWVGTDVFKQRGRSATLEEFLETGLSCLNCGWVSTLQEAQAHAVQGSSL